MKMQFDWDDEKEKSNIDKHGIDFSTAALVFGDNTRIISARLATKREEEAYYNAENY